MNLASGYLGLPLRSPFVVGASPICDSVFMARRCEDAGAGALVMRSLFEEQLALGRGPAPLADANYVCSPSSYLEKLRELKGALSIPVIASLNGGHQPGRWLPFARELEHAGADAIELNFYQVVADPSLDADRIETEMLEALGGVAGGVNIPVAVKLSPFHASIAQLAIAMELEGAAGVVIFNRFFQPGVDARQVKEEMALHLSEPGELLLRLRWLAILSPLLRGTLAASGGVHTPEDGVKALLCGAHAVQLVSTVLRHGPDVIATMRRGLEAWMRKHGHRELEDFRGRLNLDGVDHPAESERANYIRVLQSWKL